MGISGKKRPAVFLDRDGTVSKEVGYLRPELMHKFGLIPGAAKGMKLLKQAGFPLVVVTNQSGVARGLTREKDVKQANQVLKRLLAKQGAALDGIYYCPHYPDARKCAVKKYARNCSCRKPLPGMAFQAARDLGLDLKNSWMVGDKESDLVMARHFKGRGILVLTGYGKETLKAMKAAYRLPEFTAKNLVEAAKIILNEMQGRPVQPSQPKRLLRRSGPGRPKREDIDNEDQ
jgi:D-glycero-D-manno-heptose 1,7-bisphosphate phosphatase